MRQQQAVWPLEQLAEHAAGVAALVGPALVAVAVDPLLDV